MLYLFLIFLPLALAAGCIVAGERQWLGVIAVVMMTAIELGIVLWMPAAPPALWLGSTLLLSPFNGILLGSWLLMMVGTGCHAAPIVLLMSGALSAAVLVQQPALTSLLLVVVMVLGSLLPVQSGEGHRSLIVLSLRYIVAAVLGAVFVVAAYGLVGTDGDLAAVRAALLLAGIGIWVVLLPTLLVFSGAVEHISLPTLGVLAGALPSIAGIVAAHGAGPDVRAATAVALLALVPAGALLLAPKSPRRLLVLLLITDTGLMLAGLLLGSDEGLRGALLGSIVHAIAVVLLLTGLTLRYDYIRALVLLVGLMMLIGMPPLPGWYARVALWFAARDAGTLPSLLFGAGHILLIAGAGRIATSLLSVEPPISGEVAVDTPSKNRSTVLVRTALLVLLGATVLSGFAVRPLLSRVDAALAERGPIQYSGSLP